MGRPVFSAGCSFVLWTDLGAPHESREVRLAAQPQRCLRRPAPPQIRFWSPRLQRQRSAVSARWRCAVAGIAVGSGCIVHLLAVEHSISSNSFSPRPKPRCNESRCPRLGTQHRERDSSCARVRRSSTGSPISSRRSSSFGRDAVARLPGSTSSDRFLDRHEVAPRFPDGTVNRSARKDICRL